MPRVLIVDAESDRALAVTWCLAAAGVSVHALSRRAAAPIRASRYLASFHESDSSSQSGFIDRVADVARQTSADVCMAVDEPAIRQFAARTTLPFPAAAVPPLASFDTTCDKWRFAQLMARHGLPHPLTRLCHGEQHALEWAGGMRFPVLLKPRRGGNGAGIVRFHTPAQLQRYMQQHRPASSADCILQSEVAGRDVDCSVLCERGQVLACTIQRALAEPSDRFQPAAAVEFVREETVLRVVTALMSALDWSGVAHVDLRQDPQSGRVDIIEVNPRYWGSLLGSLHAGVNFPQLSVQTRLGLPHPAITYQTCRYASGGAALRSGFRPGGPRGGWFGVRETSLVHSLFDPGPALLELLSRCAARLGSRPRPAKRIA